MLERILFPVEIMSSSVSTSIALLGIFGHGQVDEGWGKEEVGVEGQDTVVSIMLLNQSSEGTV